MRRTGLIASSTGQRRGRRLPGLDLLRAAAIAWVMLYHVTLFDLLPDPNHWVVEFGWMGVDIFFVLSGYLIASQLLKPIAARGAPSYRNFFSARSPMRGRCAWRSSSTSCCR